MTRSLRELDLAELPVDEFLRRVALPISAETEESVRELSTWFMRRYPTARARFAYIRRARARVLGERSTVR